MAYNNAPPAPIDMGEIYGTPTNQWAQRLATYNLQQGGYNAINAVTSANEKARGYLDTYFGAGIGQLTKGYQEAKQTLAPGVAANKSALGAYFSLLGINQDGTLSSSQDVQNRLANTPGYQFIQQQGLDQIHANAASKGYLASGNTLKAAMDYTTGVASANYNNFVNQLAQSVGLTSPYVMNSANMSAQQGVGEAGLYTGLGTALAQNYAQEGENVAGIYSNLYGGLTALGGASGGGGGGSAGGGGFLGNLFSMLASDFGGNAAALNSPWAAGGSGANSIGGPAATSVSGPRG